MSSMALPGEEKTASPHPSGACSEVVTNVWSAPRLQGVSQASFAPFRAALRPFTLGILEPIVASATRFLGLITNTKTKNKGAEALRAIWPHFAALRWTAQKTGLSRPFGRAPAARQTIERVWHLPRLPLRPPTIALLVLLCLPVGAFFP